VALSFNNWLWDKNPEKLSQINLVKLKETIDIYIAIYLNRYYKKRGRYMRNKILSLILVMILVLSGCANLRGSKNLTPLKVRLSWLHTAEFAGLYIAKKLGYYEQEGLDVSFEPYDFDKSAIGVVHSGDAQIGFGSSTEILLARADGIKVKAFSSLFQISPCALISLKSSSITTPKDLNGKTIGIECGTNTEYQERAMLMRFNVNFTETCSEYDINQLLSGEADAIGGFITNEPILFRLEGYDINTMLVSDYGVDIYPNVMFADDDYIANNPDIILGFLRATKKGIEYSLEHTEEVVDEVLKYDPDLDRNHQIETMIVQTPLIFSGGSPIGWMGKSKWETSQEILLEQNVLDNPMDVDDAYTMQFLDRIYK